MELINYEKMTAPQLKMRLSNNAVLLLSFGSIEQHSTHLPLGTDSLCSFKRAENIARRTGSVLFSPLSVGYSYNHKNMFGTVSLSAETILHVIIEILDQLCVQGWQRYIIFSGHAGNWSIIESAVQIVRERFPLVQIILSKGLPAIGCEQTRNRFLKKLDFHAGKIETAIVNYYFPELVDNDNIPPGNNHYPQYLGNFLDKDYLDIYDELLLRAMIPQNTESITLYGNWGIESPSDFSFVPVAEAMQQYEDFFVELIKRWDSM
ncbi:MAG: creatininase family protein [Thermoguttaceae bacterium]|nr:creatininase family protein [Thermoguttaceae bacterium]